MIFSCSILIRNLCLGFFSLFSWRLHYYYIRNRVLLRLIEVRQYKPRKRRWSSGSYSSWKNCRINKLGIAVNFCVMFYGADHELHLLFYYTRYRIEEMKMEKIIEAYYTRGNWMRSGKDSLLKSHSNTKSHFGFQILEWKRKASLIQSISSPS